MIEQLENRILMISYYDNGIGVTSSYNGGDVSYFGTQGDDRLMFAADDEYAGWIEVYSGYQSAENRGDPFSRFRATNDGVPTKVQVHGQNGNDLFFVTESVVGVRMTLLGGNDNDTLIGSANGPDAFVGGSGRDTVSYKNRPQKLDLRVDGAANDGAPGEGDDINHTVEVVIGGNGDDTLWGNAGPNELQGGPGRDKLFGGGGDDTLYGNADDDTLDGGAGADRLDGGDGHDTASYVDRFADLDLTLDGVANDGADDIDEHDNILANVETVKGGAGDDYISLANNGPAGVDRVGIGGKGDDTFQGSAARDVFSGGDGTDLFYTSPGNDYYMGDAGWDQVNYFHAPGNAGVNVTLDDGDNDGLPGEHDNVRSDVESVRGTPRDDTIHAASHPNAPAVDNFFWGDAGNDKLYGYKGNDVIVGRDGDDTIDGGAGDDELHGEVGKDDILGGDGNDLLTGGEQDDDLDGGAGDDLLKGGGGSDTFFGGADYDTVSYEGWAAVVVDIDGFRDDGIPGENDNVLGDVEGLIGSDGADVLRGTYARNTIDGGKGDDEIYGGVGVDTLRGGPGNDQIFGEEDGDTLDGGTGGDTLDGGTGVDTADYAARAENLRITLDGAKNDGAALEGDNVSPTIENVRAGSGNDLVEAPQSGATWNEFWGGGGTDNLHGFGGIDTLHGDAGVDHLYGGDDTDVLDGGTGGDTLDGGAGDDQAWYGNRNGTVVATLDGLKNDGEFGENDLIYNSVEGITGGFGHDTLTGNAAANKLYGLGGNDTITGGGGADALVGGFGNDTLVARDGVVDYVSGGPGTDKARADNDDDLNLVETLLA